MYSGSADAVAAAYPLLATLSDRSTNVMRVHGGTGAASTLLLIQQMLMQMHLLCAAEAMAFGAKLGLDPHKLYSIIKDAAYVLRYSLEEYSANAMVVAGAACLRVESHRCWISLALL
jgi:3-hydroxyisobutyrate dehydrogenase-like beta-hydroxyacid dehydrogenase